MSAIVWIGFLPMMQFSLARNMFMHCHALHFILFFFPMPYSPAVSLCFSSLSLSLSLSLSRFSFLLMAPKKSVPSKNSIRRCGSSSSSSAPSLPNFVRFHDEKAKDDFFENFSDWVIHSERQVILSNFSDTSLPDEFRSRG